MASRLIRGSQNSCTVLESAQLIELQLTVEPRPPCWQLKLATRLSNALQYLCILKVHATQYRYLYPRAISPYQERKTLFFRSSQKGISGAKLLFTIFFLTSSSISIPLYYIVLFERRACVVSMFWRLVRSLISALLFVWAGPVPSFTRNVLLATWESLVSNLAAPAETLFSSCSLAYFFQELTSGLTKKNTSDVLKWHGKNGNHLKYTS